MNKGRDTRISIGGHQNGNIAVGGSVINVSGSQQILRPDRVPEVMARLDEIVRILDAHRDEVADTGLLDAARAATDEVREHQPRRKLILARLTDIASGIKASATLVAAVGPLVDAAVKLLR